MPNDETRKVRVLNRIRINEVSAVDRPAQEGARIVLLKRAADEGAAEQLPAAVTPLPEGRETEGNIMEPEERIQALEKKLKRAEALAALSDAEKAHMATLGDDAEAFLAKGADERLAIVKAATEEDPVVLVTAEGHEIRKSYADANPAVMSLAKTAQTALAEARQARTELTAADLEKRATEELDHVPGTLATKAAVLAAIDGMEDEAIRADALAMLKAQNAAMSGAFDTVGTEAGSTSAEGAGGASEDLKKRAATLAKEQGISKEAAILEVVKDPDFAKAYEAEFAALMGRSNGRGGV